VTFVLQPNTVVPLIDAAGQHDVDWIAVRDGSSSSQISYAAVTSRSYHSGLVNVFLMDGSVRSVTNSVDLNVWRALATRAGGEVVPPY
jgi:prepilin-type processing-associated H-X9-DG protein